MNALRILLILLFIIPCGAQTPKNILETGKVYEIRTSLDGIATTVEIIRSVDNGWFECWHSKEKRYINFNLVIEITQPATYLNRSESGILSNLRMLYETTNDLFFPENPTLNQIQISQISGPGKLISFDIPREDGEDYNSLIVKKGEPISITTKSGFKMEYRPDGSFSFSRPK